MDRSQQFTFSASTYWSPFPAETDCSFGLPECRLSIAERLLEGLSVFHAYSGDGDTSSEPTGSKGKSRHARWLNKSAVRQKVFIDGAERVVKARLPLGAGSKCVNYGELDILVRRWATVSHFPKTSSYGQPQLLRHARCSVPS